MTDLCPICQGELTFMNVRGPWGESHLVCNNCKKGWQTMKKYKYDGNITKEINKTLEFDEE